jgi:hypothetical protein
MVKAGVCVATVLTAGTLAVLKFARPHGPDSANASASQSTDAVPPQTTPRDPNAAPSPQDQKDAQAARAALREYFARIWSWKMDRALDLCHATNGDEQLLATTLAEYGTVQYACRQQARKQFGDAAVQKVFGHLLKDADFANARTTLFGEKAVVTLPGGQHWPMVRVEGQWKVSIFDYAVSQHRPPAFLAAAYTEVIHAHIEVGRQLREGRFATIEAFDQALHQRLDKGSTPATPPAARKR